MNTAPKAYSFIRFSRPDALKDDSLKRQIEKSRNYAQAKGLDLDDSLAMKNEAVSTFSDKHNAKGPLGLFLEAVKIAKVPTGSLLIIENLDMLSREELITALNLFNGIIEKGVSIVTLTDELEFTRDTLNANVVHISRRIIQMLW